MINNLMIFFCYRNLEKKTYNNKFQFVVQLILEWLTVFYCELETINPHI